MMLAAKNSEFGPAEVVQIKEVIIPRPKRGQVLVRVHASTVSVADYRLRSKDVPLGFGFMMSLLFGFSKPKYESLGTDLAGEVIEIGEDHHRFQVGDRIVVNLGMKMGGHAQYVVVEEGVAAAKIPSELGFSEAVSLVFGGTTALCFLRDKLKLVAGERLLVIGAGGAVGSAAVQLGHVMGAVVTGVCSEAKAPVVAELGASRVIAYQKSDWRADEQIYDVILDTVGGTNLANCRHKLSSQGRLGLVVADLPITLLSAWQSMFGKQKAFAGAISDSSKDLEYLISLWKSGSIHPLIGQTFPLKDIVAAHRSVETGHKLGSVVVEMWA